MVEAVDFYFDFSSSYTYVALPKLDQLSQTSGVDVTWKPILLGVIFKASNHAPPDFGSVKGRYVRHDVERCAASAGLPYRWPKPFPFSSVAAARVFWALTDAGRGSAIEWAKAVFHASFGEGRDCSSNDVLADVAVTLGHDAEALFEASGSDHVKQKLRHVTDEAMQRGVFGAPTFVVGDEMFWGGDRVGDLARFLEKA